MEFDFLKPLDNETLEFIKDFSSQQLGSKVVYHTEKDFPDFDANWNNAPATFSVMIECLKKDDEELIAIESSGDSSAAKLLGRFRDNNLLGRLWYIFLWARKFYLG